jgi:tetratricopeptide (TPR) repeat protein
MSRVGDAISFARGNGEMKRICSLLFASTLIVLAAIDCAGASPASAATLARTRARCLSDDVSGDEAVTACTAAIRKNPKDAKLYVQRGVAWSQTGDYDYAIGDFSKAIRLDPSNASAFYNLGIAQQKKGELQESLVDFKRYAELRPLDPDARTAIERVTEALAAETAPRKTAPQTASAAIAEHFGDPLVAQVETTREPETSAPKAANGAGGDFLLFLPALFMLAGATAVAMLIGKGGNRTADARGHPDNIETEPVAAGEVGSNIEPDPPMAWCWSEFKRELDESPDRREPGP